LEKRIEGVERWFLRKNEVLLKSEKKRGKTWFLRRLKEKGSSKEVPKNWWFKKKEFNEKGPIKS